MMNEDATFHRFIIESDYRSEFNTYIRQGFETLRKRGYVPRIASDVEFVFKHLKTDEEYHFARENMIAKIWRDLGNPNFIEMPESKVRNWFQENKLNYDTETYGTTKKRFEKLLEQEPSPNVFNLMAFYLQEIHPKVRSTLEYQFGRYEDNPGIIELRLLHDNPEPFCEHYRLLANEFQKLCEEVKGSTTLTLNNLCPHFHTSLHEVKHDAMLDEVDWQATNIMRNSHPQHTSTFLRFLELQAKCLSDSIFFAAGPDKLKKDNCIEDIIISTTVTNDLSKSSCLRCTDNTNEVRNQAGQKDLEPELVAVLHLLAPALLATEENSKISELYEKGKIVKASPIKKLNIPPIFEIKGHRKIPILDSIITHLNSYHSNVDITKMVHTPFTLTKISGLYFALQSGYQPMDANNPKWEQFKKDLTKPHSPTLIGSSFFKISVPVIDDIFMIEDIQQSIFGANGYITYHPGGISFENVPDIVMDEFPVLKQYQHQIESSASWKPAYMLMGNETGSYAYKPEITSTAPTTRLSPANKTKVIQAFLSGQPNEDGQDKGGVFSNSVVIREAMKHMAPPGRTADEAMKIMTDFGKKLLFDKISYPVCRVGESVCNAY